MRDSQHTQPVDDQPTTEADEPCETTPILEAPRGDLDGAWGYKTAKFGDTKIFFGYHEHTILQVPHGNTDRDDEPRLINRLMLTPANADLVAPTLELLDSLARPATDIIIDRAYSYKKSKRWRDKLAVRGIAQCLDLYKTDHGFTDVNGVKWAAGWPHCPATPDHLGTILRPAIGEAKKLLKRFRATIEQRQAYAFRRVTSPRRKGEARWECPAAAGQVGCPLVQGTVQAALDAGLPQIEDAPDPDAPDFPKCCSQPTVTMKPKKLRKLMQAHYWGSPEWEKQWKKRPYVEGSYGNRKNRQTENMTRGQIRVKGIEKHMILHSITAAVYNVRLLRKWHERTGLGDPTHPLLRAEEEYHGYKWLTAREAAAIAEMYRDNEES